VRNELDDGTRPRSKRRLFTEFLSFSLFRADISSSQKGQQLFDFSGKLEEAKSGELLVKIDEQTATFPFY
jgi:hypothetical protein